MKSSLRPPSFPILRSRFQRGLGAQVWDTNGKSYFDFHAAYATLNQGHCHPKIVAALLEQAQRLTLTSNAIQHDQSEAFAAKITSLFGYQCVIPMNSGTEACETAVKYARRWGYEKKNIPENQAQIIVPTGTYSGHSMAAVSFSTEEELRRGFGPFLPGFRNVAYGNAEELESALADPNVAALLLEPIQGESGIIIPPAGYLAKAAALCRKHNVLLIADEIQTGLGRTGYLTACEHEKVKPDILVLGKALSGGLLPISAILCNAEVGNTVGAEEHNSTFAANPLACRVATAALEVVEEENLAVKAQELGDLFRREVDSWDLAWVKEVRGCGLLNCLELRADSKILIWSLSRALEESGVIALPITKKILRFSPPLVITRAEMQEALGKIKQACLPFS